MATRFAVGNGLWSSGGTWDNGSVPLSGDTIYPNGFIVTIDSDIIVESLYNAGSNVYLPNKSTPKMTSNSSTGGLAIASIDTNNAYKAFNETSGDVWYSNIGTGWLGFVFPTPKIIKRYYLNFGGRPASSWTFDASNDGTNWLVLNSVSGNSSGTYLNTGLTNTTGFTYYRLNVLASVTANILYVDFFDMTEQLSGTTYGSGTGGYFQVPTTLSGVRNISFTGEGVKTNAATATLLVSSLSGSTVNFNSINYGYIIGPNWLNATGNFLKGIELNGTGVVNFNSSLYGQTNTNNADSGGAIYVNGTPTINIYGNIYGGFGGTLVTTFIWFKATTSNNAVLSIYGDIIGSPSNSNFYNIYSQNSSVSINVVGNITSGAGRCIFSLSGLIYLNIIGNVSYTNASSAGQISVFGSSIINITGSITTPPNAIAINCNTGAATVNIPTGVVIAGTNAVAISAPSATLVTVFGPLINTNNTMAVYTNRLRFYLGTTTQWRFQDTANATRVLYQSGYTGTTIGLPVATDVRKNTVYGQYNELTGTLVVPSPSDVRINVLTDNTVGTGQLTAEDFLNAITASTLPIAVRLQNISTTQTMGTQLAALSGRT